MTTKAERTTRDQTIRRMYRETEMSQREIAQRFGLSQNRVSQIIRARPAWTKNGERPEPGGSRRCPTCGGPWWHRGEKVRD